MEDQSLSTQITTELKKTSGLLQVLQEGKIPVLKIPAFRARNDREDNFRARLEEEAFKTSTRPPFRVIVTTAASPHTPETTTIDHQGNKQKIPAHFIVWGFREDFEEDEKTGRRNLTFLEVNDLPPAERKVFIQLLAQEVLWAVITLQKALDISDSDLPNHIRLYTAVGYTPPKIREKTGLSRGAQTAESLHIMVAYHPSEKYKEKISPREPTIGEFLKYASPLDNLITTIFGDYISAITNHLVKEFLDDRQLQTNISISPQGWSIQFSEGLTLPSTLELTANILGFYSHFYNKLRESHEEYWTAKDRTKTEKKIQEALDQFLSPYLDEKDRSKFIERLLHLISSLKPTYGQICNWLENNQDLNPELGKLKEKYEKLRNFIGKRKELLISFFESAYKVDKKSAEALLFLIEQQLAPPKDWQNIEFTMPFFLSVRFMIEDYHIANDNLIARKLTLAPRFLSSKGIIEDLLNLLFQRET